MPHKPVLIEETLRVLNVREGSTVVDGTLGNAGHSLEILERLGPKGRLIGLDQDPKSIERCRLILKDFPQATLHVANFLKLDRVLSELNITQVDAVLLDVGFSSDQLEDDSRGFSFLTEGPLDMRMSPEAEIQARDLVNDLSQQELEKIFWEYGEERRSRKFAAAICRARAKRTVETTGDLSRIILEEVTGKNMSKKEFPARPGWAKRHPATKVFQALRIAVNDELNVLKEALLRILPVMKPGGRLAVITFHSLEDRIVKHTFRDWEKSGTVRWIVPKPIVASREEMKSNPRSRSAKLRAVEKIS